MSQPVQNQQVNRPSAAPKSNPPQPKTNKLARLGEPARPGELARRLPAVAGGGPDAFARLAEAAASAQAYLNNPKAEKTSTRHEPVRLVPDLNESPRPASQERDGASPASSLPEAAVDQPARSAVSSSRATSHRPRAPRASTVRQAKNYLRVSRSPSFLRSSPNLPRHRRKCAICRHPEREMIEELFIRWHSPQAIANFLRDYEEINWVSIYRHAYALGLDAVRRRNLRHFFENLLDDAINATPTFAGVLGAARALGCVTEDGRWVEPEKRILMTTVIRKEDPSSTTSTDPEESPARGTGSLRSERSRTGQPVHDNLHETATASAASAPPVGSGGSGSPARDSSARWGGGPDLPACAVRAGRREIRLPLNSHKTKEKTISNR